jgi:hypothetical protein
VALGRRFCRRWSHTHPPKERRFTTFLTELEDGGFLLSTSGRPDMAAPDSCIVNRQIDAAPDALWRSHRDALLRLGREAKIVEDDTQARAALERHHAALRDFHLARGVFAPLAPKAAAQFASRSAAAESAAVEGARFPEEMAEIERLQASRPRGPGLHPARHRQLFVVPGRVRSLSGRSVLPILFHEAGHYIAMRVFLPQRRIFFLPLFGAAVVGRNRAAGWETGASRLPARCQDRRRAGLGRGGRPRLAMSRAAMMLLLLNGFNLLPFLPLDGGGRRRCCSTATICSTRPRCWRCSACSIGVYWRQSARLPGDSDGDRHHARLAQQQDRHAIARPPPPARRRGHLRCRC